MSSLDTLLPERERDKVTSVRARMPLSILKARKCQLPGLVRKFESPRRGIKFGEVANCSVTSSTSAQAKSLSGAAEERNDRTDSSGSLVPQDYRA
jgi:hypothetical protein